VIQWGWVFLMSEVPLHEQPPPTPLLLLIRITLVLVLLLSRRKLGGPNVYTPAFLQLSEEVWHDLDPIFCVNTI